jgi:hypothetical protein
VCWLRETLPLQGIYEAGRRRFGGWFRKDRASGVGSGVEVANTASPEMSRRWVCFRPTRVVLAVAVVLLAWTGYRERLLAGLRAQVMALEREVTRVGELQARERTTPRSKTWVQPVVIYSSGKRPAYLRRALRALANARHARRLLLIVSLDGAPADGVAAAIDQATFCETHILVRPVPADHPPQHVEYAHPCTESECKRVTAGGALSSSGLIHLRHHWWWTMEQTWEASALLDGFQGDVLFLEDDFAVSPDFVATMQALAAIKNERHDAWGGALSKYGAGEGSDDDPFTAYVKYGHSATGYFFNRTIWHSLRAQKRRFFGFYDGWDWCWYHLAQMGLIPPAFVYPALPRVCDFGIQGLTKNGDGYRTSGLGQVRVSQRRDARGSLPPFLVDDFRARLGEPPSPTHCPCRELNRLAPGLRQGVCAPNAPTKMRRGCFLYEVQHVDWRPRRFNRSREQQTLLGVTPTARCDDLTRGSYSKTRFHGNRTHHTQAKKR